jgi:SAM-dependent methyltransferase
MISDTNVRDPQSSLVDAVVANALQPNDYELLRRLGKVLGINADSRVLLVAEPADQARAALEAELGCSVEIFRGDLRTLPYSDQTFDSAIIATPLSRELQPIARELSRVLKPKGYLGMVAFSIYRDQMPDDTVLFDQVTPLLATSRPAPVYRAVLAECGFTAFVSEDRKREMRRVAESYYQHMLPEDAAATPPQTTLSQALGLLATGIVGVTLITAEKVL